MEKKKYLELTLCVDEDGNTEIEIYEPNSGGFARITHKNKRPSDVAAALYSEIMGWVDMMEDEEEGT